MCRARRMNFSRKTSAHAKGSAGLATRLLQRVVQLVGRVDATRMPRPPPPIEALTITGIAELWRASVSASASSVTGSSLPGRTGTFACCGDAAGRHLVAELFEDLRRAGRRT